MTHPGEDDEYYIVDDDPGLAEVIDEALEQPAYAMDTEFHRERSYFPKVALVQINWGGGRIALIDPLAVSLAPLAKLLDGPGLCVMHASDQDMEVLDRATGTLPTSLFDTQIAAGFIGMRSPSLAALHDKLLSIRLPKGDRLTDWLQRPLREAQLDYAASDVRYLLELHKLLVADLEERGRFDWAQQECDEHLAKGRNSRDPATAWLRIKESRHLGSKARGIAQALAEWRELKAMDTDQPPRFVLPDLGVVGMAQRPPKKPDGLRRIRGVDDRHLRGDVPDELMKVIADGADRKVDFPKARSDRALMEELRPAVTLVSAWLNQYSRDIAMDPALIGTRAQIEALLRGDDDAALNHGWRAELVGAPIQRLVGGEAALAFESGRLVLEDRIAPRT